MKDEIATASPRVGMRQRHLSSSSETGTPKTPKSGKVDDRHFFGSNFNIEVASLKGPFGECYQLNLCRCWNNKSKKEMSKSVVFGIFLFLATQILRVSYQRHPGLLRRPAHQEPFHHSDGYWISVGLWWCSSLSRRDSFLLVKKLSK